VLFWTMYAVFTILETHSYVIKKGITFELKPLAIFLSLMALLMYGNNNLLIPQLLEKKRIGLYITGILIFIVGYTYFRSLNQQYWDGIVWPDERMPVQSYFLWNFLYAVWFIIISSLLYFTQKWTDHRQRVKNIQISELQAELKYLRSQLNPHFLFNGLNTIYGNIDISNQQARNILLQFSDLLRYNLYEADVDWVDLRKETVYLENYVALQKARSNANLKIQLFIETDNKSIKVAPLIFIAFVENAFKFSSRDDNTLNFVKISLKQSRERIMFNCENSYEENESPTGGIGLNNVKRRLELLYKDCHTLSIKKVQSVFSVELIILV
jgi:hypothetical protein